MANVGQTVRLRQQAPPDCGAAPGDLLGARFRLRSVVGHGGQAVVFAADDLARGGAPAAVKVARRDLAADARAEAEAVLRWEGGLLRRLRHAALPRLFRLESGSRSTWLARELAQGEPLLELCRRGPQEPRQVLEWAKRLCDLLTYLHTRDVPTIAGDLKPANLVVRADQTLALIDLGAAHTLTRRPPRKPRPRHGTPGYAPPEQLGSWGYDERADVFALAVTCYELLTGLDPTNAPLQFELDRLDRVAPRMAPALRWALELDQGRRCPTAAVLRARLGSPAPVAPLLLGAGVALTDGRDLAEVIRRAPRLIEPAISNGALEHWLATSPDSTLGALRYSLRVAQRAAPPRRPPIETLLTAMAPAEGSPLLQFDPPRLQLGEVPLKSWRIWGRPQPLALHNTALAPLRWELASPARRDAEVRLLVDGKPQRQAGGVIAPGERVRIEVVAMAAAGPRSGELQLRCGRHSWALPWEATGRAGVPVAGRHVARLEELDFGRPDLVPALEQLMAQGALARWLRATGRRALAVEVDAALARGPGELEGRLVLGRVLHTLAPARFPALRLRGLEHAARPIIAGEPTYTLFQVDNLGGQPCPLVWRCHTSWARVAASPTSLGPGETGQISVRLHPPRSLRGPQPVALELEAGALPLNVVLPVQVSPDGFWQRLKRLFG